MKTIYSFQVTIFIEAKTKTQAKRILKRMGVNELKPLMRKRV